MKNIYKLFLIVFLIVGMTGCGTKMKEPVSSIPASILPYYQGGVSEPKYDNLLSESSGETVRVGMLLPLTGKSAAIGEELRNAAMMAQFDSASDRFVLQFYDTEGTEEGAQKAFREAVDEKVQVVLGPVFAEEVVAIRRMAKSKKIPVISFTSDTDALETGIYSMALSISAQAERSLRHACEGGKMRLTVMAPDNKAGDIAIEEAQKMAEMCGMEIVKTIVYNPTYINYEPFVLSALPEHFAEKKDERLERRAANAPPVEVVEDTEEIPIAEQLDFDALFIADSGNRVKSISSLFSLYDVNPDVVMILGMYSWQDNSLTMEPGLQNAVFSSLPTDKFENWFAVNYKKVYGKTPSRLASLAYDAVALTAALSQQKGGVTRELLTDPVGFDGVDGLFRISEKGPSERLMGITQIRGKNNFKVIRKPSASFWDEYRRMENLNVVKEANLLARARQDELKLQEEMIAAQEEAEAADQPVVQ